MSNALKSCCVCSKEFLVKFRYQIDRRDDGVIYYCSQSCRTEAQSERGEVECANCGSAFELKYAYQRVEKGDETVHFCSMDCRNPVVTDYRRRATQNDRGPMRIAVLNQKGGTGKTTTTVNMGAGLAAEGHRVLIIDVDSQGHVGISLGADKKKTLYHLLVEEAPLEECVVSARPNLDILAADETLASSEIVLARMNDNRDTVLRERLRSEQSYDFILLDCGPSLSILNMNALTFADHLLVPVSCDYLSLVGVKQVLKTLKNVNQVLMHPISILGILPTFYDMRNNISDESVRTLKGHFHDKVLSPIRINTRLKEAPQHQQTIFEYAPDSRGANDYRKLVEWLDRQSTERWKKSA
jgi:chromosome partitioning protein